jgi:hypothetical protein
LREALTKSEYIGGIEAVGVMRSSFLEGLGNEMSISDCKFFIAFHNLYIKSRFFISHIIS